MTKHVLNEYIIFIMSSSSSSAKELVPYSPGQQQQNGDASHYLNNVPGASVEEVDEKRLLLAKVVDDLPNAPEMAPFKWFKRYIPSTAKGAMTGFAATLGKQVPPPATVSLKTDKAKKPNKDGSFDYYMNWVVSSDPFYFGPLKVFSPPLRVGHTLMPPFGDYKDMLPAGSTNKYPATKPYDVKMHVAFTPDSVTQAKDDIDPKDKNRGKVQGEFFDWAALFDPEVKKAALEHQPYEEKLAREKKVFEGKKRQEKDEKGASKRYTQKEIDDAWAARKLEILNTDMAPTISDKAHGEGDDTVFTYRLFSKTRLYKGFDPENPPLVDKETHDYPHFKEIYAHGFIPRIFPVFDPHNRRMSVEESWILRPNDVIVAKFELKANFKKGNEKGKLHCDFELAGWQILHRNATFSKQISLSRVQAPVFAYLPPLTAPRQLALPEPVKLPDGSYKDPVDGYTLLIELMATGGSGGGSNTPALPAPPQQKQPAALMPPPSRATTTQQQKLAQQKADEDAEREMDRVAAELPAVGSKRPPGPAAATAVQPPVLKRIRQDAPSPVPPPTPVPEAAPEDL